MVFRTYFCLPKDGDKVSQSYVLVVAILRYIRVSSKNTVLVKWFLELTFIYLRMATTT